MRESTEYETEMESGAGGLNEDPRDHRRGDYIIRGREFWLCLDRTHYKL